MKTPQIIYLVFTGMGLLLSAYRHGKPRIGNESFWVTLFTTALVMAVIAWGGFFK